MKIKKYKRKKYIFEYISTKYKVIDKEKTNKKVFKTVTEKIINKQKDSDHERIPNVQT